MVITMLSLNFFVTSDETMAVVQTPPASEKYVFNIALFCRSGSFPISAALKLGQNAHKNSVPVKIYQLISILRIFNSFLTMLRSLPCYQE